MHPNRKYLAFMFAVNFGMVAFLIFMIRGKAVPLVYIFLVIFSISSALLGYRLYSRPDNWYHAQEQREQEWFDQHPRLGVAFGLVSIIGIGWLLFSFVRRWF